MLINDGLDRIEDFPPAITNHGSADHSRSFKRIIGKNDTAHPSLGKCHRRRAHCTGCKQASGTQHRPSDSATRRMNESHAKLRQAKAELEAIEHELEAAGLDSDAA